MAGGVYLLEPEFDEFEGVFELGELDFLVVVEEPDEPEFMRLVGGMAGEVLRGAGGAS